MDRLGLPESVRISADRLEPFEPERITRSLFAAAERLGSADAFLVRELTEGVLHFLAADPVGDVIAADQLADVVAKVVRELGQPELAKAFEQRRSQGPMPAKPRPAGIYPPELVAAHVESLIQLTDLSAPAELAGIVYAVPPSSTTAAIAAARELAAGFVAIDGPEFELVAEPGTPAEIAKNYLADLRNAATKHNIRAILNLHIESPPPRLAQAAGPLFDDHSRDERERRAHIANELADRAGDSCFTVWRHVAAAAIEPAQLAQSIWLAQNERAIEFVFDRPAIPIRLGPGIDRQTPATLLVVGVNLARLVELMAGPPVEPTTFLAKVGSLARFAKTAGHVKQDFLRKHGRPAIREGFLLDRARLVLVPLGLAVAARATDRPPSEFARDIVKSLRSAAENDRPRRLPIRVDACNDFPGWDSVGEPGLSFRHQIRSASMTHAAAGAGRLLLHPPANGFDLADAVEAVQLAAQSSIGRLRFAIRENRVEMGQEGISFSEP